MYPLRNLLIATLLFHPFYAIGQVEKSSEVSELYGFSIRMMADYGSLDRFYYIENSPERINRLEDFYRKQLDVLGEMDFDALSQQGKVDYILSKNYIERKLLDLIQSADWNELLDEYILVGASIYEIQKKRRRGYQLNGQEVAKELSLIAQKTDSVQKAMENKGLWLKGTHARYLVRTIRAQKYALYKIFDFYNGYDPQFTWWVTKPYKKAVAALDEYGDFLKNRIDPEIKAKRDDGSGIIGNPIGKTALKVQLQREMIPYSAEELIEIAKKEFEWCDRELLKASREMGFGDDWKAAQEKVKQSYVPMGKQPEAMLELYNQSIAFLKEHQLITIPPLAEETWRMSMIPPERQRISPFFLGGEVLQIAYPTDDMTP